MQWLPQYYVIGMSRIVTITVVVAVILTIHFAQFAAIEVLGETRDQLATNSVGDDSDLFDQDRIRNQLYTVVVKWAPVIVDGGIILWAFAREYRRQRTTAVRPGV